MKRSVEEGASNAFDPWRIGIMLGFAGSSYALFALVWSVLCVLSGAVVTDTMLRDMPPPVDADHGAADA